MQITNRFNSADEVCVMRFNDIEEVIAIYRALRFMRLMNNNNKYAEQIDAMLKKMDRWHRVFNARRYSDLLVFT